VSAYSPKSDHLQRVGKRVSEIVFAVIGTAEWDTSSTMGRRIQCVKKCATSQAEPFETSLSPRFNDKKMMLPHAKSRFFA
jgi:hypothetical protein